jgi:peptidoglycan/xylan/chitin deacetylase (PgdA/CDA1 family)
MTLKNLFLCLLLVGIAVVYSCYVFPIPTAAAAIAPTLIAQARPADTLSAMDYLTLRTKIVGEYPNARPGKWGEFVKGVDEDLDTNCRIMALTFDACGTKLGNGYNAALINFLRREHIPATLFVTGLWIDANPDTFATLAHDPLFEIENHGLRHRPCAVCGETEYGIRGTLNVGEAVDEIELNNRKIKTVTGRRPVFFRSPTAFCDEECVKVAGQLSTTIISYDILSGDAVAYTPARIIAANILHNARDGAIVIMHMNHPQWYTLDALRIAIPELRKQGYQFVRLEHHRLRGRY